MARRLAEGEPLFVKFRGNTGKYHYFHLCIKEMMMMSIDLNLLDSTEDVPLDVNTVRR